MAALRDWERDQLSKQNPVVSALRDSSKEPWEGKAKRRAAREGRTRGSLSRAAPHLQPEPRPKPMSMEGGAADDTIAAGVPPAGSDQKLPTPGKFEPAQMDELYYQMGEPKATPTPGYDEAGIGGNPAIQSPTSLGQESTIQTDKQPDLLPADGTGSPATVPVETEEAVSPPSVGGRVRGGPGAGVEQAPAATPDLTLRAGAPGYNDGIYAGDRMATKDEIAAWQARDQAARGGAQPQQPQNLGSVSQARVGNLDVSFDQSVSPGSREAFLSQPVRPTAQIDRGPRPSGFVGPNTAPAEPKSSLPEMPQLFSKETHPNMRFDEIESNNKQLLANWGDERVRMLANQGLGSIAGSKIAGDLAEQQLRNQGGLDVARLGSGGGGMDIEKLGGGTDDKGRAKPQIGIMRGPDGQPQFVNTKYTWLTPNFNPYNPSPQDAAELQRVKKEEPKLYKEIMQDYGRMEKEPGFFKKWWGKIFG